MHISATSQSASSSDGDSTGGNSLCNVVSGTNSGISSWSLSTLIGVDDADEHGVSGMNAGHWHFCFRQSEHSSGFTVDDIFILLKAVSKSRLALRRNKLRYVVSSLPFLVCSCTEHFLASHSPAVWLVLPRPRLERISAPDGDICPSAVVLLPSAIGTASPGRIC